MHENSQIPELTFALESFTLDCEARNLRPSTIQNYRECTLLFYEFIVEQGVFCVEDIKTQHVRAYIAALRARGLADATVASTFGTLRVFFSFLVSDELIDRSPTEKMRMPKADIKMKPSFTKKEIQELLAATTNCRDRALILFMLDTGARISEILALNVGDVDIKTGRVYLTLTKDREQRTVYLGLKAKRELLKYFRLIPLKPDAPLWVVLRTKKRLKRKGVSQMLRRLAAITGVKDYGPHKFRRTFGINFLRNGGDIFTLQRIFGHSTLEMVRKYLDSLDDDDAAEAHKKYSPGDSMG